ACARRPCDHQRALAPRKELGVHQEEGERAEMVAVQMREHDAVDLVRIETLRLEGDKRGRPAIDEQLAFRCFEKEAGVEPAAGAEGITRSDDRQAHGQADAVYTENSLNSYSISLSPNRHSNSLRQCAESA